MKPLAQQTFYEILEVPPEAAPDAIDAAYARARSLYGPGSIATYTLLPPDEAELLMARLEEARATLLDGSARARYDERLAALAAALPAPASPWAPPREVPPVRPVELAPPPDDEDEDEAEAEADVAAPPPPAVVSAPPPSPERTAPPRPAPIRLDREVIATTPVPPPVEPRPPVAAPDATTWTGEILRNVREARGISLQVIAERTKVIRRHLENIEADRFADLPAPVYLRGILLGLARELRLDGQKVARSYLERMTAALSAPAAPNGKR